AGAAWPLAGIPCVLLQAEPPPPPCEDAEALERRVLALVATEARSATLASQGLSLALNAGAGLALGALLDDWVGALVNFLVNSAISALVLATTPRGTRARWERYQLQFAP
ncbi:MAG: hypothetical protein INH37_17080, partial [Myxococcaceae bacterium]|nr:hypothetical protein [Myxococcaceae bacterium]